MYGKAYIVNNRTRKIGMVQVRTEVPLEDGKEEDLENLGEMKWSRKSKDEDWNNREKWKFSFIKGRQQTLQKILSYMLLSLVG